MSQGKGILLIRVEVNSHKSQVPQTELAFDAIRKLVEVVHHLIECWLFAWLVIVLLTET